jgi:cation diffusion facilitator family transporter
MFTEAIHSFVDTGNQGLLLHGLRRAARPPDERHPFGHGLEVYFWSFVVALLIFALGGAFSIYEGIAKIRRPEPIESAWVNFVVIGVSMLFEGLSFRVAYRGFRARPTSLSLWEAIRRSKDPTAFAVLLEDAAALTGLVFALLGVGVSVALQRPEADGVASVAIGLLLVFTALVLANETRSLLTGESAAPRVLQAARTILEADPRIAKVHGLRSLHLGPEEVLLTVSFEPRPDLSLEGLRETAKELRDRIEEGQPLITRIFFQLHPPGEAVETGRRAPERARAPAVSH